VEVRENLFAVLYQIVLNKLQKSHKKRTVNILDFLRSIEAPHTFPQLFLLPTRDFLSNFTAFVKHLPQSVQSTLSMGLLDKVVSGFLRLARKQHKVSSCLLSFFIFLNAKIGCSISYEKSLRNNETIW